MLSDEELSEIERVIAEEDEPGLGLLDRATCLVLLADLRSLRERVEKAEACRCYPQPSDHEPDCPHSEEVADA